MRKKVVLFISLITIFIAACGSAGTATEVKIAEDKSLSFEVKTAYADMRPDLTAVNFALGNYDFSMKPKTLNSIGDVKEGQIRITFGLKGEKGEDFNNPVQPGEYADAKLKWVDIYHFADGSHQTVNIENRKGKVTITEVTDTEIKGSIDVIGDNGKTVKANFTAKKVK